ncbi:MAG: bacterioferritin [Cyanophyceae cyanobacterium]
MKGSEKVIKQLRFLLRNELAARDQYFAHGRAYDDMGLSKLYERLDHEMQEEIQHADMIIKRMLFLEAKPDLSDLAEMNVGSTVQEMMKNDLDFEYRVTKALREAIAVCEAEQDYQTRQVLLPILADTEEDHAHWLEQQLGLIEKLGLPNYLQSQM